MEAASKRGAGWQFWAISGISLLWNAFGCYDYTMTKLDPVGYMSSMGMTQEAIDYTAAMPSWLTIFWALGVWGSLAGSVLLLLRSRRAIAAFYVSLLGLAVSQAYQWFAPDLPAEMSSAPMIGMTVVIWVSLLFFVWYSRRALAQGILK